MVIEEAYLKPVAQQNFKFAYSLYTVRPASEKAKSCILKKLLINKSCIVDFTFHAAYPYSR